MILIDARHLPLFTRLGLNSSRAVEDYFTTGASVPRKTGVLILQVPMPMPDGPDLAVFYKRYHYGRSSWKFWGRKSKARREFENYDVFARLEVSAAERVACGEERDWLGRLRSAFIITRAVPGAQTLTEFLHRHCPDRSSPASRGLRDSVLRQLAAMTRRIHGVKFFHHDLVWRNVLVTRQSPDEPKVWWIDCPRGSFGAWPPLNRRRALKDLALLNKSAIHGCTARERLQFVKHYLERARLNDEVRRLIHDTLEYRNKRWPRDWDQETGGS